MMSQIAIVIIIIAGLLIISQSRTCALMVTIAVITLIPMSSISIGPASFYPARLIIIFGTIRVLIKGELSLDKLNAIDKLVILWSFLMIITNVVSPREDNSIIARFGFVYDVIGIYFLYRFWIRSKNDFMSIAKAAAVVFFVLSLFMFYEKTKNFNLLSYLGGVKPFPTIRDGKIRCQGSFAHAILAGTIPATSLAWFVVLYFQKNTNKFFIFLGAVSSIFVVILSNSSGPIMSLMLVIVGLCAWPFRENMRMIRLLILVVLIILSFLMSEPIWFIIARIDLTGSSTGWHRSELIDSAIRHLYEWWLLGTDYTRHWMPTGVTWSERHTDITNQYIKNGVNGGIATMFTFIMTIVQGFSMVGKSMKNVPENALEDKMLVWTLGATLFSHTITFLSVSYFDQSYSFFYLALAMIGYLHSSFNSRPTITV